jgi:transposase
MKNISMLGIDLAKSVFQLHGNDAHGHVALSKRVSRRQLLPILAKLPVCDVAMEACGGAHYWARQIQALGHRVKLIPPQYVKPFVQGNKTDARDASAIAEAAVRPATPQVAVKTVAQQDIQAMHRIRERLIRERTAIGNELRGLLAEQGVVIPRGHTVLRQGFALRLSDIGRDISATLRELAMDLHEQWQDRDVRIKEYDRRLLECVNADPICQLLKSIPGIGVVNASLLRCHAGDVRCYRNGRQFSASLGLVPRQHSSGGRERALGISKRGSTHVRRQLVHGARALLLHMDKRDDCFSRWAQQLVIRRGKNKATVAVANKLARIAWAVMASGEPYRLRVAN